MEQHLGVMRDIQQKMLQAKTGAERQALAPAHSRAMREALAAIQANQGAPGTGHGMGHGMGHGAGMPMQGHPMGQQHAVMQMLMEMLVLRVDLLSGVDR